MAKTIKIRVVRKDPIDAEKLAAALVELADQLTKQVDKTTLKTPSEGK